MCLMFLIFFNVFDVLRTSSHKKQQTSFDILFSEAFSQPPSLLLFLFFLFFFCDQKQKQKKKQNLVTRPRRRRRKTWGKSHWLESWLLLLRRENLTLKRGFVLFCFVVVVVVVVVVIVIVGCVGCVGGECCLCWMRECSEIVWENYCFCLLFGGHGCC